MVNSDGMGSRIFLTRFPGLLCPRLVSNKDETLPVRSLWDFWSLVHHFCPCLLKALVHRSGAWTHVSTLRPLQPEHSLSSFLPDFPEAPICGSTHVPPAHLALKIWCHGPKSAEGASPNITDVLLVATSEGSFSALLCLAPRVTSDCIHRCSEYLLPLLPSPWTVVVFLPPLWLLLGQLCSFLHSLPLNVALLFGFLLQYLKACHTCTSSLRLCWYPRALTKACFSLALTCSSANGGLDDVLML